MDRAHPRFRLFDLRDQPDGRSMVWHEVSVDHTPGDEVTGNAAALLFDFVEKQPWKMDFWNAYVRHKKATLYDPLPF